MTDLERFIDLYKSFGVVLEAKTDNLDGVPVISVYMDGDTQPKFKMSYIGFFSIAYFTPEGIFINQGFWE